MKYVYYNPATFQVEGIFDTPKFSRQANWETRGFVRAMVPPDLEVTRDHKITDLRDGGVVTVEFSLNHVQPLQ